MKKLIVTGCAGFIGSHLTKRLLHEGYNVIGLDNLSNGTMQNMKKFKNNKNFIFQFMDVGEIEGYSSFRFTFDDIQAIFHLAANSEISNPDPEIEFDNTFLTTFKMLKTCARYGIKEFIFPSSGSIYGETGIEYVSENFGPLLPISHYAAAKLSSEAFISSFSSLNDIKAWICRFPNVIGGHATHGAIFDFVRKIRNNPDELEVLGDGNQTKPYLYIDDLIEAILFLWRNVNNRINLYNIAGHGNTSVKEIAQMVVDQMGKGSKIKYTGGDRGWAGDVPQYYCNSNKLKKLGWEPKLDSNNAVLQSIKDIIHETEN